MWETRGTCTSGAAHLPKQQSPAMHTYNVLIKWTVWGATYGDESSYDFRDVMDVLQDIELQDGTLRWGVEGIFFFFFSLSPESRTSAVWAGWIRSRDAEH